MILKDWLLKDSFTLSLSSGFFGFFAHLGIISALEDEEIFPQKITGTSAGALVGGLWASGLSSIEIKNIFFSLKKNDFYDPIGIGGYLKGKKYRAILSDYLPVNRFKDCRFELSLSAYNLLKRKNEIFNSGNLLDAIYASTAVPGLFQPLYKNRTIYLDGGIKDRSSLKNTKNGEKILYHHLISHSIYRVKKVKIPKQDNMFAIVIKELPRVTPNNLKQGEKAFYIAKKEMKKALYLNR